MRHDCNHASVINYGHLNSAGEQTAMVGRCFLLSDHKGPHRVNYKTIPASDVERWKLRFEEAEVVLTREEAEVARKVLASLEALSKRHVVARLRPDEYALLVKITEALDA